MKSTLSLIAVTTSMVLSLFVMSCGKKDTAASLSDEMLTQMEELITAIESAKDKESAEKSATRIDEIGDELVAIAGRLDALGEPSEEDKKLVKEKMDKAEQDNKERMMAAMKNIMGNQEVGAILGTAMEAFGKKMDGVEDTFKKYGKD
ncbi:MAG: hypothetical protein H7A51_15305 [Akkermansiaceae bacterium]|nr:hypothetical protein [Akkermansiaceae bacterium]